MSAKTFYGLRTTFQVTLTNWRVKGIVACFAVSLLMFIYIRNGFNSSILGPYRYAFLVEEFQIPQQQSRIVNYISNQHSQSPLHLTFIDIFQIITADKFLWLKLPASFITGLCIIALLRSSNLVFRILVATVAIGGPITGLTYSFRRSQLDLIFTLTFALLIFCFIRHRKYQFIIPTAVLGSLVLWLNHYSYWPLFLTFAIVFLLLLSEYEMGFSIRYSGLLLIITLPVGIYFAPFDIYVRAAAGALFLIQEPSLLIDQLLTFGGSQDSLQGFQAYTSPPTRPNPEWTTFWLLGYVLLFFGLGLVWIWVYRHQAKMIPKRDWKGLFDGHSRQFLIAIAAGMLIITPLYLLVGFFYRLTAMLPIIIAALAWDLYPKLNRYNSKLRRSAPTVVAAILLACLLGLHLVPAIAPGFDQDQQAATRVSDQQSASAIHSGQYVPDESPIYTDLLHASAAISQTDRRYYITAYAAMGSDRVGLDSGALQMYGYRSINSDYTLVSHNETYGTRTWGGILPPVPIEAHQNNSRVYSNGADAIYTGQ